MQLIIALLFVFFPVSTIAQEQEIANISFNINLIEFHRILNTDKDETIIIQTQNIFDQKGKNSKTLEICFGSQDEHEQILVDIPGFSP